MVINGRTWSVWYTILIAGQLIVAPGAWAESTDIRNSSPRQTKPSGVLANAANAAAAAASAAAAAAQAATAAANAATAALEAINGILQPAPPATPSDQATAPSQPADQLQAQLSPPPQAPPQVIEAGGTAQITIPQEHSLSGLAGKLEIPVLADSDGTFAKSLAGSDPSGYEPAGEIGETNLYESIQAGRSFSRERLIADARAEQAKAQTGQALALLLPSVSVRANRGWETSSPSVALDATGSPIDSETHIRTDASLIVRQPLLDLPGLIDWKRRKTIELSRSESYRASDGDAYLASVNAYLSLVSSRLQADMSRDFEAQLRELLTYIEKRANAGAASVSDMSRVRARSQAARSSRLEQESAHAAAGIEFVRLTNMVPRVVRIPEPAHVGADHLPASLDMAVTHAMMNNPEVAALTAELQAAKIDKSAAKSRFLPRVDLEYTDNYSLHAGGDTNPDGQRDKRIMMVLNWNLFSGGGDYRYHAERTARVTELRYRLDDQRRRIAQTLSANYALLTTTRERIVAGYNELQAISTAADAMSKRMLSGNQSLLDLLDVYDRYFQARIRLVNLHTLEMGTVAQIARITRGVPAADVPVEKAETGTPALSPAAPQQVTTVKTEPETTAADTDKP